MPEKKGVYFVVNEDESDTAPRKIYFSLDEAEEDGAWYIDVFDNNGERIYSLTKEDKGYERIS